MSEISATSWIQFFLKSGLPQNVATNYAIIFSNNRIQLDMLMDLSKEYLFDMGIRTMGDVIAILRYAKEFHTQLAKDRVMGKMPVKTPKKAVERLLGHYARPLPVPVTLASTKINVPKEDNKIRIPQKATIVSLKRVAADAPYPKKIRKVPPEEEGAYRIKMPSGTTEKTRKILQQQGRLKVAKKSVFDRLGESAVSSSTDSKISSVFERLGSTNKVILDDMPTSTSVVNEIEDIQRNARVLPYKGVLKMTVGPKRTISTGGTKNVQTLRRTVLNPGRSKLTGNVSKTVSVNRINTILATNKPLQQKTRSQGILGGRLQVSDTLGVRSRLGNKVDVRNIARTRLLGNTRSRITIHKTSTVFDRLGK